MTEEPLFTFSDSEFKSLMRDSGLPNVARGIAAEAQDKLQPGLFTYESLQDGTAPIFDQLDDFKNLTPEERKQDDEGVLKLFTNVQEYDLPALEGAARATPEAIGSGIGFTAGFKAAAPLAAAIPPLGLPGLALKGVVLVGGGLGGAVLGAIAANEAEEAVFGEQAPVVPSQQAARNFGETTVFGLSLLTSPWTLTSKSAVMGKNVEFLENFKNVATGRYQAKAADAAEKVATSSGLTAAQYKAASEASGKVAEKGLKFGKEGKYNLGFTRFQPGGLLVDPRKGPLADRVGVAIAQGLETSKKFARARKGRFLGVETGAAVGAGTGAYFAQDIDPYDPTTRLGLEFIGAGFVPPLATAFIERGPEAFGAAARTVRNYISNNPDQPIGVLDEKYRREAGTRLLNAIRLSEEYDLQEGETQLEKLIQTLMDETPRDDVQLSVASFAKLADQDPDSNVPFMRTLQTIDRELARESDALAMAGDEGKEALLNRAIQTINTLSDSGDPMLMTAAARLQQTIFEENIADNMSKAVTDYTESLQRVIGREENLNQSNQVELGKKLFNIVDNQVTISKQRETNLWGATEDMLIPNFFRVQKDGTRVPIDKPNALEIFDIPTSNGGLRFNTAASQRDFEKAIGDGAKTDIENIREFFDAGATALSPAQRRLANLETKVIGTYAGDTTLPKIRSQIAELPEGEQVAALRAEANRQRGKFSKKRDKDLANLLDAEAEVLIAGQTRAKPAVAGMGGKENPMTTQFVYELRGNMLTKAAQAGAAGDLTTRNRIRRFADALFDDLTGAETINEAYHTARAYSYARNNVFTRSFLGDIQVTLQDRSQKVQPEDFGALMLKGDNRAVSQRITEINNAIKFGTDENLAKESMDVFKENVFDKLTTEEAIDSLVRDSLSQFVKKTKVKTPLGETTELQINPTQLESWRRKPGTQELFTIFPQLKKDTDSVEAAKELLDSTQSDLFASKSLPEVKAFQAILDYGEKPALVVAKALESPEPDTAIRKLVELAKRFDGRDVRAYNPATRQDELVEITEEQALKGLRYLILQSAVTRAGGTGIHSPTALQKYLFEPFPQTGSQGPRLIDVMRKEGMMSAEEIDLMQKSLKEMSDVEKAFARGDFENVLFRDPTLGKMLTTRILGASFGGVAQKKLQDLLGTVGIQGVRGGLVAESAGSEMLQKLLLKSPEIKTTNIMVNLMNDPKALGAMLRKLKDENDLNTQMKKLETVFSILARSTGRRIPFVIREGQAEEQVELPAPDQQSALPPVPVAQVQPRQAMPQIAASPPAPSIQPAPIRPTTSSTRPVDRNRFVAAFPEDRDLVQGIGSLMS